MGVPLKVLMVEDSEDDAQLLLREIRRGEYNVEYERIDNRASMESALSRQQWDIVICDYSLPQFNALTALEILKKSEQDLPFIIVSGSITEEAAVTALKAGAHDFLTKNNLARLLPAIDRELREAEIRRERRRTEGALLEAEAQHRSLIEQLPMIVYINSAEDINNTVYVSPQVETILGYTPREWLEDPKLWQKVLHPEDRQDVLQKVNALNQGNESFDMEYRMIARNGRVVWFRDQAIRVRDAQGSLLRWQGLKTDITKSKQYERELEAIAEVSAALRTSNTLDDILPHLLDETLSLVEADAGNIWLDDSITGEVRKAVQSGQRAEISPLAFKRGQDIPTLVVERGETIISHEFRTDPRVVEENRVNFPEGIGGACFPLRAANKVVGGMCVYVNLPREIKADELQILNALAEIGGNAIHRANLYEQTLRQVQRMAALRTIDITINSSLDLGITLNIVLDQVITQLRIDAADVLTFDQDSKILRYAAGKGFWTRDIESSLLRLGDGFPGQAVLQRQVVHIENIAEAQVPIRRSTMFANEKFVSYYAVPLIAKGKIKGVLEIFNRTPLKRDSEWLEFLEALGGQAAIAIDNSSLFLDLQRSNLELALAYDATIEGWSHALDLRDKETEGHTQRVTETTLRLARLLGMKDEQLVHIRRGALLHDIGKMGVPDNILLKPDKLTEIEWDIMRKHPQYAYEMLREIDYLHPALDIPYCHHEKWDGTGYPRGLKGDEIPLAARIFAVVDVWDALSFDRPYRAAWPKEEVLKYIIEQSGSHFEPRIVAAFTEMMGHL